MGLLNSKERRRLRLANSCAIERDYIYLANQNGMRVLRAQYIISYGVCKVEDEKNGALILKDILDDLLPNSLEDQMINFEFYAGRPRRRVLLCKTDLYEAYPLPFEQIYEVLPGLSGEKFKKLRGFIFICVTISDKYLVARKRKEVEA